MPRTVKVVIRPNIDQSEREQNICSIAQQFKQYYCHTREESLKRLAITLEDQAFRHAETRDQYSYNLESLSSQELEKATQLHAEITASVPPDGTGFGTSQALSEILGTDIAQGEANFLSTDISGGDDNLNNGLSKNDKKARQQIARRRIMTRRRKRAQNGAKTDWMAQPQTSSTTGCEPTQAESSLEFFPGFDDEGDKRGVKRCPPGGLVSGPEVAEWIDEFCNGNVDICETGSSFLGEIPQDAFDIEECNDMDTCLSSSRCSESEGYARKRKRITEETSEH